MKKVLVLGAGLVSRPLVRYLLERQETEVTVASRTVSKAEALIEGSPNGKAVQLNVKNDSELENLIRSNDLVVSLLPYTYHVKVAGLCIKYGKNMATTSYVSKEMKELDRAAKDAGITILNEIGVDPGIDHMSAMKIIHDVEGRGGRIISFKSYCGGLPAPEANDNPYGYKFSWSPRGVLMAGKNNASYMEDGKIIEIDGKALFDSYWTLEIPGAGLMETYPNRDSLGYIGIYGLKDIKTMFRGTLRNLGWCSILEKLVRLGVLDDTKNTELSSISYKRFLGKLIGKDNDGTLRTDLAKYLDIDKDGPEINAMEWLGLLGDEKIPTGVTPTPIDIMTDLMLRKMSYDKGERDMLVMHHNFDAQFDDHSEELTSTMIDFGIPNGDSSMARTVSLPCAIGVWKILEGKIKEKGVLVPVLPTIYTPILEEMESLGIKFTDTKKEFSHST